MKNNIAKRQNEERQLKRLLAQRRLYSSTKSILAMQMVITLALVIVWNFVVLWNSPLKVYAGLYGILAALADVFILTPWQNRRKRTAAGIQELFDCEVLELPWQEIKAGRRPDQETITEWSQLRKSETYENLKLTDWYPHEASETSLAIGRLICQRMNCWWDSRLRRRYSISIAAVIVLFFLVSIVFAVVTRESLVQFLLTAIAPFLPVFTVGLRQISDQRQAATRLDELKAHSEGLWSDAISGGYTDVQLTRHSRTLQDEIFEQRKRSALVFDWVYWLLRNRQEELMNRSASDLLQEAADSNP